MNHGDVFWVNLPSRGGHEQSGRRPDGPRREFIEKHALEVKDLDV
jgi:hypothetical protein